MNTLPLNVTKRALVELQEACIYLASVETPWEPYDELSRRIHGKETDGFIWLLIPWKHMNEMLKVVEQAKDCCNRSESGNLVGLLSLIFIGIENRGPIERLGDLVG